MMIMANFVDNSTGFLIIYIDKHLIRECINLVFRS